MDLRRIIFSILVVSFSIFGFELPNFDLADFTSYVEFSAEYKSKYIDRCRVKNPDPIYDIDMKWHFILLDFYVGGHGISDATNFNIQENVRRFEFEQYECRIAYEHYFDWFYIDTGYCFTDRRPDDLQDDIKHALFLKTRAEVILRPGIEIEYDVEKHNWFIAPSIFHAFPFSHNVALLMQLEADIGSKQLVYEKWTGNDLVLMGFTGKCFLRCRWSESISFGPIAEFIYTIDDRVRKSMKKSPISSSETFVFGFRFDYTY